jgi:DNA polymerase III sliding clamp (beta) subunit (PCNA family)
MQATVTGQTLTFDRAELAKALKLMAAVAAGNHRTKGMVISSTENGVRMYATDLDVIITYDVETDEAININYAVDAQSIAKAVASSKSLSVSIAPTDTQVTVTNTDGDIIRSKYTLPMIDLESVCVYDMDVCPTGPGIVGLRVALKQVIPAVAATAIQYAMTAINLQNASDSSLAVAATDTHRLHLVTIPGNMQVSEGAKNSANLLAKGAHIISEALAIAGDNCAIDYDDKAVIMRSGPITVSSQCVQGKYPKYQDIVQLACNGHSAPMPCESMLEAFKQATAFVGKGKELGCNYVCDATQHIIQASKDVTGEGEAIAYLDVVDMHFDVDVNLTPTYVVDALQAANGEMVKMHYNGPKTPVAFVDTNGFVAVVMPIAKGA